MSALESLISSGGEAPMLDSLDFTLPPSSTAVTDRRQHVRAYPTSASTLSPTGVRTCRLRLGGDDFVDAQSVRIMYTINNLDGTYQLAPKAGPWGHIAQIYLRSNGAELDSIPAYGRFHQQYLWNQSSMAEQFGEAGICGMGGSYGDGTNTIWYNTPEMGVIAANGSFTVIHKLGLSLFNSGKLLPTRYAPLEVEISTTATPADWLTVSSNKSSNYTISNIQLMYDAYVLDEAVQNSFYKALLANRVLSIPTMTVYQVVQSIPAGSTSFSFAAVRAFSRLSHVWLTFRNSTSSEGAKSNSFIMPTSVPYSGISPALTDASPTARLSVGSHYWPDPQPTSTVSELYYQFQQALPNIPNLSRDDFCGNFHTIVFDLRKVPSDPTSAISTRSGDLLRVDLGNLTADRANECWMTLFAFSVTAIRESGVTLLT